MSDLARPGGTAELCLRPVIPATRFIPAQNLAIHPAAAPAFELYRTITVSARLPALLAGPIPALRGPGGRVQFFGNFAERLAWRDAPDVPILFVNGLGDSDIARIAWAEILLPAYGQLRARTGHSSLHHALQLVPTDVRCRILDSVSPRALAKHLSCDVSRFREVRK